jgi:toxin FitB
MYLVDTDVISNARKRSRANPGVRRFFRDVAAQGIPLFLSAVTIGELRQGVETVRHRGDLAQATRLSPQRAPLRAYRRSRLEPLHVSR